MWGVGRWSLYSEVCDKIVSQLLLPILTWVFLIWSMCRSYSASFGFLSKEIISKRKYVFSVYVLVRGGEFRIILCHHLEPEPAEQCLNFK